ncbi:MAG TPA: TaqI-like C-terminal specificity domain-containing protein [Bacteroidales bacterium]|nr:TaqI-like C-terminal specificity domain-containing protein [Bacteroidales bacterium]
MLTEKKNILLSLNKAYLKQSLIRNQIELLKTNLNIFFNRLHRDESEEHQKNILSDLLKDTWYKGLYEINTHGRIDLAIHNGKKSDDTVGVIIETKTPGSNEMLTENNINTKALHELILYYFDQRELSHNIEIKHLVATDFYHWFIFDEKDFDKLFFRNAKFTNLYKIKNEQGRDNPFFYSEVGRLIAASSEKLPFTCFDLNNFKSASLNSTEDGDDLLCELFKILSPEHLLKKSFANDSNQLNREFYNELLHILGLEEIKEGSKKLIRRLPKGKRNEASIIENTINILQREGKSSNGSESNNDPWFDNAMQLCISWLNRILFLKLLEGQIVKYHKGDTTYAFLGNNFISGYDDLDELFFEVLAVKPGERTDVVNKKYGNIPYLNSSLFEPTSTERETIFISSLKERIPLSLYRQTVLKDAQGKRLTGNKSTLAYLFDFLDAYDFASDSSSKIQEQNKTLINASVLGLIFEKINGYKDGSFFTPGFITTYMCRETIRQAVLQKFNDTYNRKFNNFIELYNALSKMDIREANEVINQIKICDPAVGSGHFLVSALNELIAIKSDLQILCDVKGMLLRNVEATVENDELIITDGEGKFYEYNFNNKESQRIQEALFHEKQTIIENCLFGVDINPNSVKICQLRLWIELLKNAYYLVSENLSEGQRALQTLPNIDINIKCGNSLISRFTLDSSLKNALRGTQWNLFSYLNAVKTYKEVTEKNAKRDLEKIIISIKNSFGQEISRNHPKVQKLNKLKEKLYNTFTGLMLFEPEASYGGNQNTKIDQEQEKLVDEIKKLENELEYERDSEIYRRAFEWRFEFPEVLDEEGNFLGFDVIIGNPPYGISLKDKYRAIISQNLGKVPDYEIYYYFINLAKSLLKEKAFLSLIIPNSILFNVFAKEYRKELFSHWSIDELADCTSFPVFAEATVRNVILRFKRTRGINIVGYRPTSKVLSFDDLVSNPVNYTNKNILLLNNNNWGLIFKLDHKIIDLVSKIKNSKQRLGDLFKDISQGLIAYDKYQGQSEEIIKSRSYHAFSKINDNYKPWLWGEDVTRYHLTWNGKEYINYCKGIANPRDPKFFKGPRILVREITSPNIYACFTTDELYNDPAIINILNSESSNISIKSVLGILNSKLATFYHFNSSPKATKGAFPKILVDDIKNFPIPYIDSASDQIIIEKVNQILTLKKAAPQADTSVIEKEIDRIIYTLYGLTEAEIALVKGNPHGH